MPDDLDIDDEAQGGDGRKPKKTDNQKPTETVAAKELLQFIERIERLEEEKAAISSDIKDVKGEAKGRGYDTKAINTILKLRKKDVNERLEEESVLHTYMVALGMELLDSMDD